MNPDDPRIPRRNPADMWPDPWWRRGWLTPGGRGRYWLLAAALFAGAGLVVLVAHMIGA